MANDYSTEFIEDIKEFQKVTSEFYQGKVSIPEYKHFSGGFGSYAQRGGKQSMLRLRLAGGEVNQENMEFIVESIKKYHIELIHFTTCQTIQLHNLSEETVCQLVQEAYEHGIITRGGGGDYPRNVMCSPLSGVDPCETFDVLPYAKESADYLLGFIHKVKLPRKLKVCFCNNDKDETHATFRDLGFVAKSNQTFDVYIAGGLGIKPKMGVPVLSNIAPDKVLYCIKSMVDIFTQYGNYENRAASRTRYMQDSLGVEELKRVYVEKYEENLQKESLDLSISSEEGIPAAAGVLEECHKATESNSGDSCIDIECPGCNSNRIVKQKQQDQYAVFYHPIGGSPDPSFFFDMLEMMQKNKKMRLRITPEQGVYIINLNLEQAKQVLAMTKGGSETEFEASTACIGAAICQVGIGNSQALLEACVDRVRQEHFADHVLPSIHISGCPSSCSAHQIGRIGFRGGKKPTPEGPKFAFAVYENGEQCLGEEQFGTDVGVMLADDIPEFLVDLGKEVASHGMTYEDYRKKFPDGLKSVAKKYI